MEKRVENKKIAVLTSGGDSPGMNSAIQAIFLSAKKQNYTVYGVKDGYLGLYNNQIEILHIDDCSRVINTSGTFLGTARSLSFKNETTIRQQCAQNLKNLGIHQLIVIGGDGSYHGAMKLEELGIQCIGLPATIDNDINKTDFTIGFSTSVNNVLDAIEKLRDTSLSHNRCTIIEVMGRYRGDLALYGGLAAGVDLIVTKENNINKQFILDKVKKLKEQNKRHVIIVITENIFNVHELAKEVESFSGFETRAQVLGHIQRGGIPTVEDRVLATRMGHYAIQLLNQNIHNCGISLRKQKMTHFHFEDIFDDSNKVPNELFDIVNELTV
ncbi:ATP-dependent 6-phosphofructokinase ['Camptotheca acuminata' phytoplasma]|uniref:ATP-dependent 6-phosphofructokinase n=1 Tax='Camptotheca acuminata' phytoplasma TaxID=3239192 RepID=UPI00351A1618